VGAHQIYQAGHERIRDWREKPRHFFHQDERTLQSEPRSVYDQGREETALETRCLARLRFRPASRQHDLQYPLLGGLGRK
jgi:hypothetical protein